MTSKEDKALALHNLFLLSVGGGGGGGALPVQDSFLHSQSYSSDILLRIR